MAVASSPNNAKLVHKPLVQLVSLNTNGEVSLLGTTETVDYPTDTWGDIVVEAGNNQEFRLNNLETTQLIRLSSVQLSLKLKEDNVLDGQMMEIYVVVYICQVDFSHIYTLWQMVEMHEMVPGKRFDQYHEVGQHAFGEKLGLYIVVPQQLIMDVGVNIVYMVTGGQSLKKFHDLVYSEPCKDIKLTYFIMIFASVHSIFYSTIAWVASLDKGVQPNVDYSYKAHSTAGRVFSFFNALGTIDFAYAGHNVLLEIQATIPSTPKKPCKDPMWKGVMVAYIVIAICYFPVAIIGFWMYGNIVSDNILISLYKPTWLIVVANLFVVVHVIGSYQIEVYYDPRPINTNTYVQ
ncbi:lysine histidine transporter 1-like protein [Tanacetum coccineum]